MSTLTLSKILSTGVGEKKHQSAATRTIQASQGAFVAIRHDHLAIAWGHPNLGGSARRNPQEPEQSGSQGVEIPNVWKVKAAEGAFAAILLDGSVKTWGFSHLGGSCEAVQDELVEVQELQSTSAAFAALLKDGGRVVAWGNSRCGGTVDRDISELRNVRCLQATKRAFAAIKEDGSVVTWGHPEWGGDSSGVQHQLSGVVEIQASHAAFAAILEDRSVVTWGDPSCGGDSSAVREQLLKLSFKSFDRKRTRTTCRF